MLYTDNWFCFIYSVLVDHVPDKETRKRKPKKTFEIDFNDDVDFDTYFRTTRVKLPSTPSLCVLFPSFSFILYSWVCFLYIISSIYLMTDFNWSLYFTIHHLYMLSLLRFNWFIASSAFLLCLYCIWLESLSELCSVYCLKLESMYVKQQAGQ